MILGIILAMLVLLSATTLIYFFIVFLTGFMMGPDLLRDSGMGGHSLVVMISLLIVGMVFYLTRREEENWESEENEI